jgi:hypothetical protein
VSRPHSRLSESLYLNETPSPPLHYYHSSPYSNNKRLSSQLSSSTPTSNPNLNYSRSSVSPFKGRRTVYETLFQPKHFASRRLFLFIKSVKSQ